jgi:hypothetical protein
MYFSAELAMYAVITTDDSGPTAQIGLNPAERMEQAGPGVWIARGMTVRRNAGADLLISVDGARRVLFSRVVDPQQVPTYIRGLV